MNLKYSTDFWTFYMDNKTDMDKILWRVCWSYRNVIDPEDLHSKLLIRLQRSGMLDEFDPAKSSLNTYVTQRVRGYTSYILKIEKEFTDPLVHNHPLLEQTWNSDDVENECTDASELSNLHHYIEEQITVETVLKNMKQKCTPSQWKMIRLRLQGLSIREIHETGKFKCSQIRTYQEWAALKSRIVKECQKQGVLVHV
jgi:hypothetical protein